MAAVLGGVLALLFVVATLSGYGAGAPPEPDKDKSEQSDKKDKDKKDTDKKDADGKDADKDDDGSARKARHKTRSRHNDRDSSASHQHVGFCVRDCPGTAPRQ